MIFILTSTENTCLLNISNFHFCVRHPLNTAMEGKQKAGETKSMARAHLFAFPTFVLGHNCQLDPEPQFC